jgi:membrane glycosyltransferase
VIGPQYFVQPRQLFPIWPKWNLGATVGFLVATGVVLFTPKILGGIMAIARGARQFGGGPAAALSVLLEILFSAMLAPIRMLFHTQFVLAALTGLGVHWKSPRREDAETTWGEAVRRHGVHTLIGAAWVAAMYWLDSFYAWWLLLPVVGPLTLSIPISVYSSRVSLGRRLRRARLLCIPEESDPPDELRRVQIHADRANTALGFLDAVVHPGVNAMACALARARVKSSSSQERRRDRVLGEALIGGPRVLSDPAKIFLLTDAIALSQLHLQVWTSPAAHPDWLVATRAVRDKVSPAA